MFHSGMAWAPWYLNDSYPNAARTCVNLCCRLAVGVYAALAFGASAVAGAPNPRDIVAQLDMQFQAAVKVNDAEAMGRILGDDMILVLGNGTTNTRAELLQEARDKSYVYERQEEDPGTQTVRVWGDTAIVTARLWVKGLNAGKPFDRHLWFSDVYVRTATGWHYVFGQASLHLPEETGKS